MRRLFLLALVCVSPVACDLLDDDSPEPGSYIPAEEVASAQRDAYCTHAVRCGIFPDKQACVSANILIDAKFDANVLAAIQAGKIAYDGRNLKKCLDAQAEETCDRFDGDYRVPVAACSDVLHGLRKDGETCVMYQECASMNCSVSFPTNTCAVGVCIGDAPPEKPAPAQIGEECFGSGTCVAGAYCDFSQPTSICAAYKTQGMACMFPEECAIGLACAGVTGATTCVQLPGLDEPCSSSMPCGEYGMYCDTSATQPTCKKLGLPPTTCTSSEQCSSFYPCDLATGTCTKAPSVGESCATTSQCFDVDTYCDATTSICTAAKSDGSTCSSSSQCASHYCDTTLATPVCVTPAICY